MPDPRRYRCTRRAPHKRFVALNDAQARRLREQAERRSVSESSILREAFETWRQQAEASRG